MERSDEMKKYRNRHVKVSNYRQVGLYSMDRAGFLLDPASFNRVLYKLHSIIILIIYST